MATWKMVEEIGLTLPEVSVGLWYNQRALRIGDKGFLHLGDGNNPMAFPSDEKDDLLLARPDAFFQTPHHERTKWLLVHLSKITKAELRELLRDAWHIKAPPKIRKAHPEV